MPEEAGIGATRQRLAIAAPLLSRSGSSPAATNGTVVVSVLRPPDANKCGIPSDTRWAIRYSRAEIPFFGQAQVAASDFRKRLITANKL